MSRNLGKMGESKFANLCHSVDIVATKPDDDRFGWDYYVEFPDETNKSTPKDSQTSPIECKVQIKSTDTTDNKCQIKVSAMLRLVQAQMPSFVCFMIYNQSDNVEEIYLLHIDEQLIEKILKRVRELETKNKLLHKSKITIHYSEEDKLHDVSGKSLKEKIEKNIPKGMNEYIETKNRLLQTVGFDERSHSFKVTFPIGTTTENLINMSLGLEEPLGVQITNMEQKRFGISLPIEHPLNNAENTVLSISPKPTKKAIMLVKDTEYGTPLIYKLDLYNSPFNYILKEKNSKHIFKNEWMKFTLDTISNEHNIEFEFDVDKLYKLDELLNVFKFVYMAEQSQGKALFLELSIDGLTPSIKLQIVVGNIEVWMLGEYDRCKKLFEVYNNFELPTTSKVTLEELRLNYEYLNILKALLFSELENFRIDFNLDGDFQYEENMKFAHIVPSTINLNSQIIGAFFILITDFKQINDRQYQSTPTERIIIERFVIPEGDFNAKYFEPLMEKAISELEKKGINSHLYSEELMVLPQYVKNRQN